MANSDTETVEIDNFLPSEKSEKTKENEMTNNQDIPTDRGWAWLILAGGVLTMTIIVGCHRTAGILFIEFQEKFQSSSAETTLVSTIQSVVFCVAAPFVMTVGMKMTSSSFMVLIGGVLLCSSSLSSAFVKDIRILFFTHGVLQGFGFACIDPPTLSTVTKYFKKRRGFAGSVTSAGASFGGLILPPLVTYLFEQYGYMGCLIILAAINLNVCVAAALYRHQHYLSTHRRGFCTREKNKKSIKSENSKSPLKVLVDLFDVKLFREPFFILYQLAFGFLTTVKFLCMFFLPPYAKEVSISSGQIATLVIIFNATDMLSRLILGFISDLHICRRSTIVCICAFVMTILANFARYYKTFWLLVLYALIAGFTGGAIMPLHAAIIADYLPLKYLDSTLGFATFSLGAFGGIFIYVGGVLNDMTGSYVATFHLVGALSLAGGLIMASIPYVDRIKKDNSII